VIVVDDTTVLTEHRHQEAAKLSLEAITWCGFLSGAKTNDCSMIETAAQYMLRFMCRS
jgi:hypothetical protein